MIIKKIQREVFVNEAYREFLKTLTAFMEKEYPEEIFGKSKSEVEKRLWYCINKARRYGISFERDITLFMVFCIVLGDDFDEQSDNQHLVAILKDESLPIKQRLDDMGEIIFSF